MRARLFKSQFASAVKTGLKRQTVRPIPKRMPKIGDDESWREWTGLPYRSKQRELAQVELISIEEITITKSQIIIGSKSIAEWELNTFARTDGFVNWPYLRLWFTQQHGLPFTGILIKAKDLIRENPVPSVVKPSMRSARSSRPSVKFV